MSAISNALWIADSSTVKVFTSGAEFVEACKKSDLISAVQAAFEHAGGLGKTPHYLAMGAEKSVMAASAIHMPARLDSLFTEFAHILHQPGVAEGLAALGIAIYSIEILVHLFQVYKELRVHSAIPALNQDGTDPLSNDTELLATVRKLQTINHNFFVTSLPDHLKERIEHKFGNEDALSYFESEIQNGRPATAKKVVREISDYTYRKNVFHVLSIAAAICGLLTSIALIVAFPPLAVMIISAIGIALMITCYVLNKGWVENPKKGFNLKLIFPAFMRVGKLAVDLSPESVEMKDLPRVIDIERIRQQPRLVSAMRELDDEEGITDEEAIAFTKPLEPKKEKTVWEKFKAKFGPKVEEIDFANLEYLTQSEQEKVRLKWEAINVKSAPKGPASDPLIIPIAKIRASITPEKGLSFGSVFQSDDWEAISLYN